MQTVFSEKFQKAWAYLDEAFRADSVTRNRILKLSAGVTDRVELGAGVFALEQANLTKSRPEGVFESHRAYIDVQAVISGREAMEICDVAKLRVRDDFTPGRDLLFYHDLAGVSRLIVSEGEAAVFFPVDGHMPCLCVDASAVVHKTVIKVPVA